MRDGQNDEVGAWQQVVERLRLVQFGHAVRTGLEPRVDADDSHAERGAQAGRLGADAADADDERGRFRQMDDAGVERRGRPFVAFADA